MIKRHRVEHGAPFCVWCHNTARGSMYRSPDPEVGGMLWVVCGPTCSEKPEGRKVIVHDSSAST
jgi:hypothetical protein